MNTQNRVQPFLSLLWKVGALSGILLASYAESGTYNFYFNNTEQGDNSTSTPTVVIKDGKGQKTHSLDPKKQNISSLEEDENTPEPTTSPSPAPSPVAQESTGSGSSWFWPVHSKRGPFQLGLGWGVLVGSGTPDNDFQITASYFLRKDLAFSLLYGTLSAIEAEYDLIGDINQPGFALGILAFSGFEFKDDNAGLGLRAAYRFSPNFGLTAALRKPDTLILDSNGDDYQYDVGLTFAL